MDALNRSIDRFCYRHPRFGIRNLMKYIVIINVAVYILYMVDRNMVFMQYLLFSPWRILRGEIWRLITFVFIPTETNIFLFAIMQYFYYFIGSRLEADWGAGRFTIYYVSSVLITAIFGVVAYTLSGSIYMAYLSAGYINMSLFFAFATMHPNAQVLLFFFIPIKMKWLALLSGAYYLYGIITTFELFPLNLQPIAALIAYFIFFGSTLIHHLRAITGRAVRQRTYRAKVQKPINFEKERKKAAKKARKENKGGGNAPYTRKCAVCGRTDAEFPNLEFRFCSKCKGYHCFCEDHINSHVHFTE